MLMYTAACHCRLSRSPHHSLLLGTKPEPNCLPSCNRSVSYCCTFSAGRNVVCSEESSACGDVWVLRLSRGSRCHDSEGLVPGPPSCAKGSPSHLADHTTNTKGFSLKVRPTPTKPLQPSGCHLPHSRPGPSILHIVSSSCIGLKCCVLMGGVDMLQQAVALGKQL
jgi:hypothetical protein